MNIIPSVSILLGLLVRVLLGKNENITKFLISSITCTISCVLLTIIYTFSYQTTEMLNDIFGVIIYCIIINAFMLIFNTIITVMGLN
jgi:hypothetical protein